MKLKHIASFPTILAGITSVTLIATALAASPALESALMDARLSQRGDPVDRDGSGPECYLAISGDAVEAIC